MVGPCCCSRPFVLAWTPSGMLLLGPAASMLGTGIHQVPRGVGFPVSPGFVQRTEPASGGQPGPCLSRRRTCWWRPRRSIRARRGAALRPRALRQCRCLLKWAGQPHSAELSMLMGCGHGWPKGHGPWVGWWRWLRTTSQAVPSTRWAQSPSSALPGFGEQGGGHNSTLRVTVLRHC